MGASSGDGGGSTRSEASRRRNWPPPLRPRMPDGEQRPPPQVMFALERSIAK